MDKVILKDICEDIQYGYTSSARHEKIGPKFLRITDIVPEIIDWESVPYCKIERNFEKYALRDGDIVIARTGATTGYAKYIKEPPRAIFASYLIRITIKNGIDKRYIAHIVQSQAYKDFIKTTWGGAAQPNANAQVLTSFPIALPDILTQQKISSILSTYDDLIENNTRRIQILEEMAQRIYREWFVSFRFPGHEKVKFVDSELGKIPEGWSIVEVGKRFKTVLGGTPSRFKEEYWVSGNIPWINSSKINEIRIIDESEFITELGLQKSSTKMMPKRTTVVAITGATLGQVSMLEIEACANQSVVGIYDTECIFNEYIYYKFCEIIESVILKAGGGAQQHINKEIINSGKVLIPSSTIINTFNQIIHPICDSIRNMLMKNKILRGTRDLLLHKLISGELDVSNMDIPIRKTNEEK